jgi:hypothetical protein
VIRRLARLRRGTETDASVECPRSGGATGHPLEFLRAALATDRRLRDLADPLITRALPLERETGALPASRPDFRRHH